MIAKVGKLVVGFVVGLVVGVGFMLALAWIVPQE